MIGDLLGILLLSALLSDFALEYLIGICPLIAITRKLETAAGLAIATVAVAPLVCLAGYLLLHFVLVPAGIEFVALPAYVILAVLVVRASGLLAQRWIPAMTAVTDVFQPLLTVNCALLGFMLITLDKAESALTAIAHGLGLSAGYGLLLLVVAPLRERLDNADIPAPFRGVPILLLSLAIFAMAVSGLRGAG